MNRGVFIVILLSLTFLSCSDKKEEVPMSRLMELRSMELGTVACTVSKVVKMNDNEAWYKIGERKILVSCVAEVKVGVNMDDFSEDDVERSPLGGVVITLPHARVLSVSMDADRSRLVYEQISLFRSNFSVEEVNALMRVGEGSIRDDVRNSRMLEDAERNAERMVRTFLCRLGYEEQNVRVSFR